MSTEAQRYTYAGEARRLWVVCSNRPIVVVKQPTRANTCEAEAVGSVLDAVAQGAHTHRVYHHAPTHRVCPYQSIVLSFIASLACICGTGIIRVPVDTSTPPYLPKAGCTNARTSSMRCFALRGSLRRHLTSRSKSLVLWVCKGRDSPFVR
jgi:hypothetical protein